MRCSSCDAQAVFRDPAFCADHFAEHVGLVVQETIDRHSLCTRDDRVCVATSGGKDSLALLRILHKLGYRVEALLIDEGIAGYREHSLTDARSFCEKHSIPLKVVSFIECFGKALDDVVVGRRPCSVCGVFRRFLLNKYAQGYDVIATGHNLDDESQAVLMNLSKGNKELLRRSHVRAPPAHGFVPRIKPFFFLSEKEVAAYAFIEGLTSYYAECPYAHASFRSKVRDVLNDYDAAHPGMKRLLVDAALRVSDKSVGSSNDCPVCGEPSAGGACRACRLREEITGDVS